MRLGVVMSQEPNEPHEAWGVLNPGGVRAPDGFLHLFPRLIAEGNYSRIGHVRVRYNHDTPVAVERLGLALEPHEPYEVSAGGGGVEDARVVHVPLLKLYVMTYTAYVPFEPRVAVAVSDDLFTWRRLGLLRFQTERGDPDHNRCGNKDAAVFPDVVLDPEGVPSFGILHRPTTRIHVHFGGTDVTRPPCGEETREHIWISYAPVAAVLADIATLTSVCRHERVMAPAQPWESDKVGTGAPPVRLSYGWLLTYHAVATFEGHPRYCMGAAILDLERPSRVLYRTPSPILVPDISYERNGLVSDVVFPTAADVRPDGRLDVFYGAADRVIAAARFNLPTDLPIASDATLVTSHNTLNNGESPMTMQDVPPASGTDTAAVAVFDNHDYAEAAVKQLAASGFDIKKVSVVGRGFHSEEKVAGFYNAGDRIKFWGRNGALWGGLWGLFFGGLYMTIPVIGPVVVVGHFAIMVAAAIEGAIFTGGLGALGAALYSIGIPKDSVVRYEEAVKADGFLVIVHGTPAEVEAARALLKNAHSTQIDIHDKINMQPSEAAHQAVK